MRIFPTCLLLFMAPVSLLAATRPDARDSGAPGQQRAAPSAPSKQTFVYKTGAGYSLHADVFRPADDLARPVILWLHGGALIWGSRTRIDAAQVSRYVGAGFVVVAADYRLAPETKLPAILDDVRAAHEWIRASGPALFRADPDRIIVVGHSAGGYLALMAGVALEPRARALVSFYGYGDVSAVWCNQPDAFYGRLPAVSKEAADGAVGGAPLSEAPREARWPFYLYCRQQGRWAQEVLGDGQSIERFCPAHNVTPTFPPTLLLHGNQDTDVPFEQSVQMAEVLRRHRVRSELVTLPNRGHAFDAGSGMADPQVSDAFDRVVRFIKGTVDRPAGSVIP